MKRSSAAAACASASETSRRKTGDAIFVAEIVVGSPSSNLNSGRLFVRRAVARSFGRLCEPSSVVESRVEVCGKRRTLARSTCCRSPGTRDQGSRSADALRCSNAVAPEDVEATMEGVEGE